MIITYSMDQYLSSPFLNIAINIFGGLAIFMFAMEMLSSHLQNVVGDKIEKVLRKLTDNPSSGMVVGAFVTFLTQSSSITVLTLIGLVNVGVLNLSQGMGILLGAEIGTTLTAQLVTLEIGKLYFPLVIIGLILARFGKEKAGSLGKVIFAFGLLFLGMELMKTGAKPIGSDPMVLSLFESFAKNPILGIFAGAVFTAVTSSSSATTSLVVALGIANVIQLPAGIALIMGANIGTTFLEIIAVFGMSLTAKRIAVAQGVINVLGVLIMLPFIKPFAELMATTSTGLGNQVANSHTVFNVGSSMVFLIFVKLIVKLVEKIMPGEVVTVERGVKYIDNSLIKMPQLALVNAEKEVERFGQIIDQSFFNMSQYFSSKDDNFLSTVTTQEKFVDKLHLQINDYLIKVSEHEFNQKASEKLAKLMHGLTDLERTHDHLNKVAEYGLKSYKRRIKFTDKELELVGEFSVHCYSFYRKALEAFLKGNVTQSKKLSKEMKKLSSIKEGILKKVGKSNGDKEELLQKMIHNLERAAHHGENLTDIVVSGF
jgi:phosphate:Na+ symporter